MKVLWKCLYPLGPVGLEEAGSRLAEASLKVPGYSQEVALEVT